MTLGLSSSGVASAVTGTMTSALAGLPGAVEALPSWWGVVLAVFVASVVGSLHCAGMCGALVLFAVGSDGRPVKRWPMHAAYHGGRGLSYTALGVLAGSIGAAVDVAGSLAGAQRPAAIAAGGAMILFGLLSLVRHQGVFGAAWRLPAWAQRGVERVHRFAFTLPPVHRAGAIGVLTPLLPCGWLYAFVIVAAGTASPWVGGVVLLAFWLGTVPLMGALGAGVEALTAPLRARLPVITSLIVVALGIATAAGRMGMPSVVPASVAASDGVSGGAGAASIDATLASVRAAGSAPMACCHPDAVPAGPTSDTDADGEADDETHDETDDETATGGESP